MEKAIALKRHIAECGLYNPEHVDVWGEGGETRPSFSQAGSDLLVCRVNYTAVIEVLGATGSINHLLALATAWIQENGGENDALEPWEGEPVDRDRADITLRVRFEEESRYIPAEPAYAGKDTLVFNGVTWKPGNAAPDTATLLGFGGVVPV